MLGLKNWRPGRLGPTLGSTMPFVGIYQQLIVVCICVIVSLVLWHCKWTLVSTFISGAHRKARPVFEDLLLCFFGSLHKRVDENTE